jgi:glucosamine--fructose-6-phosphate aminotransferase (isomerizing)
MEGSEKELPRWISGVEPPKELLAANGTQILEIECREQPQRLAELIDAYTSDQAICEQLRKLRDLAGRRGPVLFLGMGASYCSAISGATLLQSHGRSSFTVDAGEWLHYSTSAWDEIALSILLTTSGESAELVELFKMAARREPSKALALICNNPASTCWGSRREQAPILGRA